MTQDALRIDRLLWFLRLSKSRSRAQAWIADGHIRCNSERVERDNLPVGVGDILTLPFAQSVRVIEILSVPQRRGPAAEARSHYRELDAAGKLAIARSIDTKSTKDEPE